MPDDSSADARAAQFEHASNLRAERKFMRNYGANREQARRALVGFAQERMSADLVRRLESIPAQQREPVVSSEVQVFSPQPFTLGEDPKQETSGGGGPSAPVIPPVLNLRGRFLIETTGVVSVETIDFTGDIV